MFARLLIVALALFATAAQAQPPGADMVIITSNPTETVLQGVSLELPQ
jgi:hypothetical protein